MEDKRRNRKDFRNRANRDSGIVVPEVQKLKCIMCGEMIAETASSLSDPETGEPVHFDCVMKKLKEREVLEDGEVLTYLGNGTFGIILKDPKSPAGFVIKRKIDFENKEKIGDWRKKMSYKL